MEFGSWNSTFASPISGSPEFYLDSNYALTPTHHEDVNSTPFSCAGYLHELGNKAFTFFTDALKSAGIYNRFNQIFSPETFNSAVVELNTQLNDQLNKQFVQNLDSISSAPKVVENTKITSNLYNRQQYLDVLKRLQTEISAGSDPCRVLSEITLLINLLEKNKAEHLNIKEKAKMSLSFDSMSEKYEKALAAGKLTDHRQWAIAKIISDKKHECHYQYVESAFRIMVVEIAHELKEDWKLGALRQTSYNASIGVSTPFSKYLPSVGGSIDGNIVELEFADPENFWNIYWLIYGGLSAEVKATIGEELPGIASAKAFANATAGVQGLGGTFREPKTPLALAICDFDKFIQGERFRDNPKITSYFSRARLLDSTFNTTSALDSELVEMLNEVSDIKQLRFDFNEKKKGMDQRLSLFMSESISPEEARRLTQPETPKETKMALWDALANPSNEPTWVSAPIKLPTSDVTEATIWGGVAKLSVGIGAKASVGATMENEETGKGGRVGLGIGGDFYGSAEAMMRFRDEVKYTSLGLCYMDPSKSNEKRAEIKQHAKTQFHVIENTLMKHWGDKVKFDMTNPEEMQKCFNKLKLEFDYYLDQPSLQKRLFEQCYGATKAEELLHRMHIISLYILTHSKDAELNEAILKFQHGLLHPPFEVDKKYLNEHLCLVQDLRISLFEVKAELGGKVSLSAGLETGTKQEVGTDNTKGNITLEGSIYGEFKVNLTYSYLSGHLNRMRRGDGVLLSVTLGKGINIEGMIEAVTPDFNELMPPELSAYALAALKEKSLAAVSLTATVGTETSFDFYIGKPDRFSEDSEAFSYSHYYSRKTQSEIVDMSTSGKEAIPLVVCDLTFGGGRTTIKTNPTLEINEPNTLRQYFMLRTHQYHDGSMNKMTATSEADKDLINTEINSFKKIFKNFANEPHFKYDPQNQFQPDTRPVGPMSIELFEIEKAINRNDNYLNQLLFITQNERREATDAKVVADLTVKINQIKEAIDAGKKSNNLDHHLAKYNFRLARDKFKIAAQKFRDNESEANFNEALSCLHQLPFIAFADWFDSRSNSKDLKDRPLAPVDDVNATLTARFQQAGLSGIMLKHAA